MIKMNGSANWIKVFLWDDGKSNTVYVSNEMIGVSGIMYQNCEWECSDGIFRLSGTRRDWEEKGRVWSHNNANPYGYFKDEIWDEKEAEKYENPKHETRKISQFPFVWKKEVIIECWERGNYLLKGAGEKETVALNNFVMYLK